MAANLAPAVQRFILHWGEMGVRWGINRSVAQVHALLYLAADPLPAETIAEQLELARSNVSTSLKELQSWNLVNVVHLAGDRRDHFRALQDPWAMFKQIAAIRKKRELDPTHYFLRECLDNPAQLKEFNEFQKASLAGLLDYFDSTAQAYEHLNSLPISALKQFAKLGSKLSRLLGLGDR